MFVGGSSGYWESLTREGKHREKREHFHEGDYIFATYSVETGLVQGPTFVN